MEGGISSGTTVRLPSTGNITLWRHIRIKVQVHCSLLFYYFYTCCRVALFTVINTRKTIHPPLRALDNFKNRVESLKTSKLFGPGVRIILFFT